MGKYALLKARRMRLEAGLFDPGKHFHTEWAFAEAIHKRGMALLESDDQQHVAAALLEKAAAEYGFIKSQTARSKVSCFAFATASLPFSAVVTA